MKIVVDRELCIGSENCTRYAPGTFETDLDGKAFVKDGGTDDERAVRTAVSGCPVGALSIEE